MKKYLTLFIIICLQFIFAPPCWAVDSKLILSLGKPHPIKLIGTPRIWIQDKNIIKAEVLGGSLVIKPIRVGQSYLQIGSILQTAHVLTPNQSAGFDEFKSAIESHIGLHLVVENGDLQVTGHLYRMKDWVVIAKLAEKLQLTYQMRASLTTDLNEIANDYFSNLIKEAKLPIATILFEPIPEIRVNSAEFIFKKYQALLSPFGILISKDESSLEIAPTIKVEITVAEVKKDVSIKYGLRPPLGYSAKILSGGKMEGGELELSLAALENHGMGKILASPNLICRSGKEAEFLAGGEFPIKIMNFKTQDVVWKRYGILLRVKPKADASGHMSISIETEVTTLDDSRKVDDIPGLLTNRVSSHFDLSKPQIIALSGLLKNEEGKNSEGLPVLSRLPILGALFSSKDFRDNRTELIIFVRPSILAEDQIIPTSPNHLQPHTGGKI